MGILNSFDQRSEANKEELVRLRASENADEVLIMKVALALYLAECNFTEEESPALFTNRTNGFQMRLVNLAYIKVENYEQVKMILEKG